MQLQSMLLSGYHNSQGPVTRNVACVTAQLEHRAGSIAVYAKGEAGCMRPPDTGKASLLRSISMLPPDSSKTTGCAGLTCPTMNLSRRSTT